MSKSLYVNTNITAAPASPGPALLTLPETAEELRLSIKSIRRMISDGHLPAYRFAGQRGVRVRRADLELTLRQIPSAAIAHDRRVMP